MIQKSRKQKCQIENLLYPLRYLSLISAKEKPKANYSLKNQQFVKKVEQTVKQKTEEKNAATESTL
jgi:hypothetical protein